MKCTTRLPLSCIPGKENVECFTFELSVDFFTNRCLIKDFEKRPSVTHLLDHPFIKGTQGKVLFLQKQLANVLRDQKRLNPVAKTRYGSVHRSGVLLWVFGRRAWLCFGLLYIFIGNNHIFVFSQRFICVLSSRSCG